MASRAGIRNYRFSFNFFVTPVIQWLLVPNIGIFFFEIILKTFWGGSAFNWFILAFGLVPSALTHALGIWHPSTCLFLHDGSPISHIRTNTSRHFRYSPQL